MLKPRAILLLLAGLSPVWAWGQAATAAETAPAVGVPIRTPSDTGRPGPFGTESAPRRITSAISAKDLIRMAPSLDYEVIPGDLYVFDIYHYGGSGGSVEHLDVDVPLESDYTLQVPLVGPINAKGMQFSALRQLALSRLRSTVRLQHADMWMSSPALFTIFVTGAVAQPGSVVVNGLTRVSDAIDQAGGALAGASWRRIVHRTATGEEVVDLLGWASGRSDASNPMVRPGDSVHVPTTVTGAQVSGRVRYPAQYELIEGETLTDLLQYAGGPLPGADLGAVHVARVGGDGVYTLTAVDLGKDPTFAVHDGDVVSVSMATENAPMILVQGALFGSAQDPTSPSGVPGQPLTVQIGYTPGLTLLAVLERLGGPTPYAEADKGYVARANGERVTVDMESLWKTRSAAADVVLAPGDRVVVPMVPVNVVVLGEVRSPGAQGYLPGLTVADYIRGAGGPVDGRGDLGNVRLQDRDGASRIAKLTDEVPAGQTVIVGKQLAAGVSDFFNANVFTITGVALTFVAIATQVFDLVQLLQAVLKQ